MTTDRQQTNYYAIIGKDEDGDIVMLDYLFKHSDDFQGATGTSFRAITKEEYEERKDPDNIKENYSELWRDAVQKERTELGLSEWFEEQDFDDDFVFDLSYIEKWDEIRAAFPEYADEEAYPVFECTGGGRMFPLKLSVCLRPDLVELIKKYEKVPQ